jgi:hypothetical protein
MDFPYSVDPLDHAESPLDAYQHIQPILIHIASQLNKSPSDLIIYDPYYCDGQVKRNLNSLGFSTVINEKKDFYTHPCKHFDVLITNPPYSGDHPERLVQFCLQQRKPWFILAPNWLYMKPYYSSMSLEPLILVPKKRYVYVTPKGLRAKADDGKTAPFVTLWFFWTPLSSVYGVALSSTHADAASFQVFRNPRELPMTAMDQYDPEYKRLRNRMKSEKRRNKQQQPQQQSEQKSWGHKAAAHKVRTNPATHIRK